MENVYASLLAYCAQIPNYPTSPLDPAVEEKLDKGCDEVWQIGKTLREQDPVKALSNEQREVVCMALASDKFLLQGKPLLLLNSHRDILLAIDPDSESLLHEDPQILLNSNQEMIEIILEVEVGSDCERADIVKSDDYVVNIKGDTVAVSGDDAFFKAIWVGIYECAADRVTNIEAHEFRKTLADLIQKHSKHIAAERMQLPHLGYP